MRTQRHLPFIVLLLGSAAAFAGAGCSSDDSGSATDDSGTPEAGLLDSGSGDSSPGLDGSLLPDVTVPKDTGTPDTSMPVDTGTPDTGTPETGTPDAGTDTGTTTEAGTGDGGSDAGVDSGTGNDSGSGDDGGDDGGTDAGNDSGTDSGSGDDGGTDAATDANTPYTFASPLQVDVSSIFNADTVATTTTGGTALTAMDGSNNGSDFPTVSKVNTLVDSGGSGLPDNAFFPSSGSSVPNVQLAWSNSSNVLNSVVVSGTAGMKFTFDLPPAQYDQVQVYATGGNGGSTMNVTLHYTSGADGTASPSVPDWCTGSTGAGEYKVASVDRVVNGTGFNNAFLCSIYAINLNPDKTRSLSSVTFSDSGNSNEYLVFYGATAW